MSPVIEQQWPIFVAPKMARWNGPTLWNRKISMGYEQFLSLWIFISDPFLECVGMDQHCSSQHWASKISVIQEVKKTHAVHVGFTRRPGHSDVTRSDNVSTWAPVSMQSKTRLMSPQMRSWKVESPCALWRLKSGSSFQPSFADLSCINHLQSQVQQLQSQFSAVFAVWLVKSWC